MDLNVHCGQSSRQPYCDIRRTPPAWRGHPPPAHWYTRSVSAISTPHSAGREFFTTPAEINQRRYEALRAYHVEDLTLAAAGKRFGYTRATMASLVRDFR